MKRFFTLMLGIFLLLSHGGIAAAHAHSSNLGVGHSVLAADHDDLHTTGYETGRVAVDGDQSETGTAQSSLSHSHGVVDGAVRSPAASVIIVTATQVRHVGQSHPRPTSTVVAPGLQPPTA